MNRERPRGVLYSSYTYGDGVLILSKRRILEIYREQLLQKEMAKKDSKSFLWIAIAVTLSWILLFDGQLINDHVIRMERI